MNSRRLDSTDFRVVSASEEQVELSFRSTYDPSRLNSVRLTVDKRCAVDLHLLLSSDRRMQRTN